MGCDGSLWDLEAEEDGKSVAFAAGKLIQRVQTVRDWNHRTIRTLISRLVEKEAMQVQIDGVKHLYRSAVNKEKGKGMNYFLQLSDYVELVRTASFALVCVLAFVGFAKAQTKNPKTPAKSAAELRIASVPQEDEKENEIDEEEFDAWLIDKHDLNNVCLLYTSPSPRDATLSRMPSSA